MPGDVGLEDQNEGSDAIWPAVLLLVAGLAGLALATLFSGGAAGQYVVVTSPFGTPALEVITRANGAVVAAGGFETVMIAASDRPDFDEDLRRAGALMVFPAPRFLGCSAPPEAGA